MNQPQPRIVRVAGVAATPWRNGGGVTRELLAWPHPQDWLLRVSVADIHASGPFSAYPGVDRWFAVLEGGGVRLDNAGANPTELTSEQTALHAFSGDLPTHCTALGVATRDFNIMARRSLIHVRPQSLTERTRLETRAEGVGLFVVGAINVRQDPGLAWVLPDLALAWWFNPERAPLSLRVRPEGTRGWWFEVDTGALAPPTRAQ